MDWLSLLGLVLTAAGAVSYLVMIFVLGGFTYRTWMFHGTVGLGVVLAVRGWWGGGSSVFAVAALVVGLVWLLLTWRELGVHGSDRLRIRPGDRLPGLTLLTTEGVEVTHRDVVADGPALLAFYRGWCCPTHKPQLDEVVAAHGRLSQEGLSVWAASVDMPDESEPVQERVGHAVTVLCGVTDSLLTEIGIRDDRGAPWYDRLLFGANHQEISMPAAVVADETGTVLFASRSTRIDERAAPDKILSAVISHT